MPAKRKAVSTASGAAVAATAAAAISSATISKKSKSEGKRAGVNAAAAGGDAYANSATATASAAAASGAPNYANARFTVLSFNVWNTEKLSARTNAITKFLQTHAADIMCLQEVRPDILTLFDRVLTTHARVVEPSERPWNYEGNIYWNASVFEPVSHGALDIGLVEADRRAFWVALRERASGRVYVCVDVHLTWEGSPIELVTGHSPRVQLSHRLATFIRAINPALALPTAKAVPYPVDAKAAARVSTATAVDGKASIAHAANDATYDERARVAGAAVGALNGSSGIDGVVLCGDFNDRFHHRRVLRAEAGLIDACGQLNVPPRTTWPTPSFRADEDDTGGADNVADWIFTHPTQLRAVCTTVVDFAVDGVFPSDHYPLLAVFQPVNPPPAAK